jgi:nucleoside phosphorylase
MPCAVILTALPVEYSAVRAYLTDPKEEIHTRDTIYERGKFASESQTWDIGIVEIGAGNPMAAVEAERAIAHFNPDVILFVGVAGGIKDVAIGDVVASTKVYGYESGKAGRTFLPRPEMGLSAYGLEQRARAEARKSDWLKRISTTEPIPSVFVAPIAAGEKVIASKKSQIFKFLQSNYGDALAIEMEGFGFLEAARANRRVLAMVIRGISDLIDGKAKADKAGSQKLAALHASAFAFEVLAKLQLDNDSAIGADRHSQSDRSSNTLKPTQNMNSESTALKVFISYSHNYDRPGYKNRILALADCLRADGIDCKIDQYETSPSKGWQRWMLDRFEWADFVLIACSEEYDRRFRGNEEQGKGKGATWEGSAIIQALYDAQGQNSKFIPITLDPEDSNFIPLSLGSVTYYKLKDRNDYDSLYRRLTNQPDTPAPPIGAVKKLPPRDREQLFSDKNSNDPSKTIEIDNQTDRIDTSRSNDDRSTNYKQSNSTEKVMKQLQAKDVDLLVDIMADLAFDSNDGHPVVFKNWLTRTDIPKNWIQSYGKFSSDTRIAASELVRSLYTRGINNGNPNFNTLGSLLEILFDEVGFDKARIIAAVMVRYKLIQNEKLLNELIIKYQVPLTLEKNSSPKDYGPNIDWQEPTEDIQLQGWFNAAPEFFDVGFLMRGIEQAVSVCRIETLAGKALGTGFLIDNDLVLTNYHVLQGENSSPESISINAQNIILRFGYFTAETGRETEGQTFLLDRTKPVVEYSPTEKLDYVLLRVEDKISTAKDIKKADCDFDRLPSKGIGLTILQHPEGASMKLAVSWDGITGILKESGLVQYATQTAGGSSGSPCFNEDWKVVALHHAERARSFGSIREGILLSSIYPEIRQYLS